MKILSIFGTRPEAIKMAPVILELNQDPSIESIVAVTAQHREMLDQVLDLFDIRPDYDLNIMRHGQSPTEITTAILTGLKDVLIKEKPHMVLVHGDTTTTFAAALAAFYEHIPCGHVEAGLRTANKYSPFPEEINRRLTGVLADYHFAPTVIARENLLKENLPADRILVTGNTVIDALLRTVKKECSFDGLGLDHVNWDKKLILLTCHRRESWGQPMRRIFSAVREIIDSDQDTELIFPMHKNPLVRDLAREKLSGSDRIHLIEPLEYLPFCHIMNLSYLILTDSGGMQEEAPALGKPVLVLRDVTERPEAISAGTARLVGTQKEDIIFNARQLLTNSCNAYEIMSKASNPYGDGTAAKTIVTAIKNFITVA